jgi:hypothetical protein
MSDNTILRDYNRVRPVHYGMKSKSIKTEQATLTKWHVECRSVDIAHAINSLYSNPEIDKSLHAGIRLTAATIGYKLQVVQCEKGKRFNIKGFLQACGFTVQDLINYFIN